MLLCAQTHSERRECRDNLKLKNPTKIFEKRSNSPFTHTFCIYYYNIMFAATQQIASIAGLKATKVQVCSRYSLFLSFAFGRTMRGIHTREKRKNRVFAFCERYFRSFVDCAMMMRSLARSAFESHTNCDQIEHRRCLIIGIDAFTRTSSIAWCLTGRRRLSAFAQKSG